MNSIDEKLNELKRIVESAAERYEEESANENSRPDEIREAIKIAIEACLNLFQGESLEGMKKLMSSIGELRAKVQVSQYDVLKAHNFSHDDAIRMITCK